MTNEFLKQLIQLLASHGGVFTCPLDELTPLGLELSVSGFGSSAAMLTLRLGARIYYVPAAAAQEATEPWPTNETILNPPTGQQTHTVNSPGSKLSVESELQAVTSLNNRASQLQLPQQRLRRSRSRSEEPAELLPPENPPAAVRPPKSELDLYLLEQSRTLRRTAAAAKQAKELENQNRQYPWETRK